MSMVYLANVPCIQSERGLDFYTPNAHVSVDFPSDEIPSYYAAIHKNDFAVMHPFNCFADAMDFASNYLKHSETY
jgi:polyphosphate kinase